ncbi:hypothetical protein EFL96_06270 [Lactococcus lactis]|uniref:Uncharacterized protein n=1 Tax=Lactococcus lactis TaxID=1358 RepID=A0A6B3RTH9_9LACT|nr:hypothetical protein [Lactococcus lactis]MCT1174159.1 hypothetical protein [Lactococcus lactis]MCT1186496.1 hypothetical protein [Lactococcus lactis]MCT1189558.1 hypothetical protein [Lactococcus lactis]MCT1195266.1 hypothetical protein [Lactococcus lactis]NEX49354.1 hypothetical protein [Lactococcus lactis]
MDKFKLLEDKYEQHFKIPFPTRIIGFWDPVHDSPDYIENIGYENMKKAIEEAIQNNEPIEEIPQDIWDSIVF